MCCKPWKDNDLTHCMLGNLHAFCHLLIFFKFFQSCRKMIRMSNTCSLDPDQARRFVGPDLGPNCLQRISVDNTGRQS